MYCIEDSVSANSEFDNPNLASTRNDQRRSVHSLRTASFPDKQTANHRAKDVGGLSFSFSSSCFFATVGAIFSVRDDIKKH
jgi:hypothetical protein